MAAVATGREADANAAAKTNAGSGSDEGTTTQAPGDPTGGNAGGNTASGGSQQANSARDPGCASWDQPPPTNAQLLTPGLANAFGIQMMHGYRIPAPAPGHAGNATDSGNGVHSGKHANTDSAEGNARRLNRAPTRTNANPPPAFDGAQQHSQHQQMGAASAMAAMAQQYAFASSPNGMAAQMQMHQQMHQYAVAQHFAQQAQAQQQHHARGSGVVNGPPHGHGAFYGSPGGGAGVAAARGNSLQNAHGGPPRAAAADTPRAPHRGGAVHGGAPAMDHAAVSYDQMMAFQYGVERSRTFEAFKRAREVGDPGMGAGLAPGAAGGVTRPGAPRGDVSHPGGLPLLSHGAHAHAHALPTPTPTGVRRSAPRCTLWAARRTRRL